MIFSFPELEKKGVEVKKLDSELAINKDLLKTGQGYLDVCKGLLDSIRAVKLGDVRYAQNLMTNNKVVIGNQSAKKGKEFLKRDHGIDLDSFKPSSDRFRLVSREIKNFESAEKVLKVKEDPVEPNQVGESGFQISVNSFLPIDHAQKQPASESIGIIKKSEGSAPEIIKSIEKSLNEPVLGEVKLTADL